MQPEGQTGFTTALLNPDAPVPQNIVDPEGRIAPKRFAVYRNNVTVALIEAVKSTFPAVVALVGEDFFAEMARQFVRLTPPHSPLLFDYGRDFPAFIAAFPPAAGLPFLADVARLDRAWLDAYHAADATPFAASALAGCDGDGLMAVRFDACPAMRLVRSDFPLVTIWQAARAGVQPDFGDGPMPETALVTRPDIDVGVVALGRATAGFLEALMGGETLGAAAEQALSTDPDFDFAAALQRVVSGNAFCRVILPDGE